jgi:type II secretory pathway pseudopilin PulG
MEAARSGFALPVALASIVLVAALAAATLFSASQETSATSAGLLDQQATAYAERAALLAIAGWQGAKCDSIAVGSVISETPQPHPPLESTVYITRLDSALFLVTGEGRVSAGGATRVKRRIAVTVRTMRDSLGVSRAIPLHPYSWNFAFGM